MRALRLMPVWVATAAAVAVALGGCASILGIEEALCDPNATVCSATGATPVADEAGTDPPPGEVPGVDNPTADDPPPGSVPPDAGGPPRGPGGPVDASTQPPTGDARAPDSEVGGPDAALPPADTLPRDAALPTPSVLPDAATEVPDATLDPVPDDPLPGEEAGSVDPLEALCAEYCDTVGDHCTDDNAAYSNDAQCLEICASLLYSASELEQDDTSRNTIECRLAAAVDANDGEPVLNCQVASMIGGEFCGTGCEVYCDMLSSACPTQFASFTDCEAECEATIPRTGELFLPTVTGGDSLECRVNHLRLAIDTRNPDLHCPHTVGQGPCQ